MFLMRVLLCKNHCPSFICFCKPSSHLCTAGSLKLDNSQHLPSTTVVSVDDVNDEDVANEDLVDQHAAGNDCDSNDVEGVVLGDKEEEEQPECKTFPKSSLRRPNSDSKEDQTMVQKKVQWVDMIGKELADIREFELSEEEDRSYDHGGSCVCVIM